MFAWCAESLSINGTNSPAATTSSHDTIKTRGILYKSLVASDERKDTIWLNGVVIGPIKFRNSRKLTKINKVPPTFYFLRRYKQNNSNEKQTFFGFGLKPGSHRL